MKTLYYYYIITYIITILLLYHNNFHKPIAYMNTYKKSPPKTSNLSLLLKYSFILPTGIYPHSHHLRHVLRFFTYSQNDTSGWKVLLSTVHILHRMRKSGEVRRCVEQQWSSIVILTPRTLFCRFVHVWQHFSPHIKKTPFYFYGERLLI